VVLAPLPATVEAPCTPDELDLGPPLTAALVRKALLQRTAEVLDCEDKRAAAVRLYKEQAVRLEEVFQE